MELESLPYRVMKLTPIKNSKWYVFARASNKRTALWLMEIALKENPKCKIRIDQD